MIMEDEDISICPVCSAEYSYDEGQFSCNHMVFEGTRGGGRNTIIFATKAIQNFWRNVPGALKSEQSFYALADCPAVDFIGSVGVSGGGKAGVVYRGFSKTGNLEPKD